MAPVLGTNQKRDAKVAELRPRTLAFIKLWLRYAPSDFKEKECENELLTWLQDHVHDTYTVGKLKQRLLESIRAKRTTDGSKIKSNSVEIFTRGIKYLTTNICSLDSSELARQITLVHQEEIASMRIFEILLKRYTDPRKSPGLHKISEKFNKLTNWIAMEILLTNPVSSALLISKFIQIGVTLFSFRNYHALFGVYLGLSLVADYHIGWKRVSSGDLKSWKKIKVLMDPRKNFSQLRALHDTPPDPNTPRIVTSVLYLRDLTFLDEGCQNYVDGDKEINYWKMQNLGKLIELEIIHSYLNSLSPLDTEAIIELKSKKLRDSTEL